MTLTKANSAGFGYNEVLTSAQANHWDTEIIKAIDGGGGGAYTPSSLIEIGGSGLKMNASIQVETGAYLLLNAGLTAGTGGGILFGVNSLVNSVSTTDWKGAFNFGSLSATTVSFGTDAAVTFANGSTALFDTTSAVSIKCPVTVYSSSTWGGVQNYVSGHVTFDSGSAVTSDAGTDWAGTYTFGAAANIVGVAGAGFGGEFRYESGGVFKFLSGSELHTYGGSTTTFDGDIEIGAASTATLRAALVCTGGGRIRKRRVVMATDANQSLSATDCDIYKIPGSLISNNRSITLDDVADTGDTIEFYTQEGNYYVELKQSGGASIAKLMVDSSSPPNPASGYYRFVKLVHNGSANGWEICGGFCAGV